MNEAAYKFEAGVMCVLTNEQWSSPESPPTKFIYFWKVLCPKQGLFRGGITVSLELNVGPGPSSVNTGRGTEHPGKVPAALMQLLTGTRCFWQCQ